HGSDGPPDGCWLLLRLSWPAATPPFLSGFYGWAACVAARALVLGSSVSLKRLFDRHELRAGTDVSARPSAAGAAVAAGAALGLVEEVGHLEFHGFEACEDDLGDAVAVLDGIGDVWGGGVERDHDLAAEVGIEGAEGGEHTASSEAAAGPE